MSLERQCRQSNFLHDLPAGLSTNILNTRQVIVRQSLPARNSLLIAPRFVCIAGIVPGYQCHTIHSHSVDASIAGRAIGHFCSVRAGDTHAVDGFGVNYVADCGDIEAIGLA